MEYRFLDTDKEVALSLAPEFAAGKVLEPEFAAGTVPELKFAAADIGTDRLDKLDTVVELLLSFLRFLLLLRKQLVGRCNLHRCTPLERYWKLRSASERPPGQLLLGCSIREDTLGLDRELLERTDEDRCRCRFDERDQFCRRRLVGR